MSAGVPRGKGKDGVFPRAERAGLDGDVLEEGGKEGGREGGRSEYIENETLQAGRQEGGGEAGREEGQKGDLHWQ